MTNTAPESLPPLEKHYTPEDIAAIYKIKAYTVRLWIRTGRIQAKKVGSVWRIPESEVRRIANAEWGSHD